MGVQLSELLERIRPAGAPGAPSEGDRQRRRDDRAKELATIAAILADFELEADDVVAAARAEADLLRTRGEQRAHELHSAIAERVAVAEAETARNHTGHGDAAQAETRHTAERDIAALRARADAEIPLLVDKAIQVIVTSLTESGERRP